jgi:hypothetical protein
VLDHVQGGRVLEQPAGKDLAPDLVLAGRGWLLDINLHESAGLVGHFPGRGALAALNSHNNIVDPARLADLEDQIGSDVVALVEQTERGDAVLVGRHLALFGSGGKPWHRARCSRPAFRRCVAGAFILPAGGQHGECGKSGERPRHKSSNQLSGDQAS